MIHHPVPVGIGSDVRPFERIGAEVEQLGNAQRDEGIGPDRQCASDALLHEHYLPVVIPQADQVAIVGEVEESRPRSLLLLPRQIGQEVVAVDVHLEGLIAVPVALLEFLNDVRLADRGQEGGQPIVVADDLVGDRPSLDLARPAHHGGNAEGAFPVGVLLVAEGGHAGVGPGVHVRPVVAAVEDDGVVRDAQLVQLVQQRAHSLVVVDHRIVVLRLPPPGLPPALRLDVGAEVHVRGIEPHEERGVGLVLAVDEAQRRLQELIVARLHALLGQRAGVLDGAAGVAVDHPTGAVVLPEVGKVLFRRVVGELWLLFRVQVIQVAEELVEAVVGGQMLVLVAQVVLAELAGGVAQRLQQLGDGGILGLQSHFSSRHSHLAQPGAEHALAGDERRTARRAALLGIGVGEQHALFGYTVDVGRPVAHHALTVGADVGDADVISPDDQYVGFFVCHLSISFRLWYSMVIRLNSRPFQALSSAVDVFASALCLPSPPLFP